MSGYGYGPPSSQPYGSLAPYGAPPPPSAQSSSASVATPYDTIHSIRCSISPTRPLPGEKTLKTKYSMGRAPPSHGQGSYPPVAPYGIPFAFLLPSTFPPGIGSENHRLLSGSGSRRKWAYR